MSIAIVCSGAATSVDSNCSRAAMSVEVNAGSSTDVSADLPPRSSWYFFFQPSATRLSSAIVSPCRLIGGSLRQETNITSLY